MTVEAITERITKANVPLDQVFVKTISLADSDETINSFIDSYINNERFRKVIIALDEIYSKDKEEFEKITNEFEDIAKEGNGNEKR